MGLYTRGLNDNCPPDHSTVAQNFRYNRKGEAFTRDGSIVSLNLSAPARRQFVTNFTHSDQLAINLTCDGAGNIYRSDTGGILLSVTNMVDFAAINAFSFCLISPILSNPATPNPVYIWSGLQVGGSDVVPIRPAAGIGPSTGMTGAESATSGDCDIGVHQFAVSFVTNTGYTTQPGPMSSPPDETTFVSVKVTSTGGFSIDLSNIPLGPTGTVSRQILATQADQDLFFYAGGRILSGGSLVPWDGVIHDNTTTSITISFFDTDLILSADSLFDLLPIIPAGTYGLIAGMTFYHGRTFYWGGEFNLIRVTAPGSTETIDNVVGFIQLPDQFDGNDVTSSCTLQDTLSFFKSVGIFSVTDNGNDPVTWPIIVVDAGAGCANAMQIGTINITTPSLPQNQVALLVDYGGLYLFTGAVSQPPLTWKINDFWLELQAMTNLYGTMVSIDPYNKLIYIAQTGNVLGTPGYPAILVGDYNDGLDPQNIKWSIWSFPFPIYSIAMSFIQDNTELAYRFRIGSTNAIYKIEPGALTDNGSPIVCVWRSFYSTPSEGALNIFRFIRARLPYKDNLKLTLYSEDDIQTQNPPGFTTPYVQGRDLTREFNFMNEKCAVQICCNATNGGFTLQRLDIFCKARFNMRPSV
jgi:hypothetical protein